MEGLSLYFFLKIRNVIKSIFCQTVFRSRERGKKRNLWEGCGVCLPGSTALPLSSSLPPLSTMTTRRLSDE